MTNATTIQQTTLTLTTNQIADILLAMRSQYHQMIDNANKAAEAGDESGAQYLFARAAHLNATINQLHEIQMDASQDFFAQFAV